MNRTVVLLVGKVDLANPKGVIEIDVQGNDSLDKIDFNRGETVSLETETDTKVNSVGGDDGRRVNGNVNSKRTCSGTTTTSYVGVGKSLLLGLKDGVTDRVTSVLTVPVIYLECDHVVVDKIGDLVVNVEVESPIVGEGRLGDVPLLGEEARLKATELGLGVDDH